MTHESWVQSSAGIDVDLDLRGCDTEDTDAWAEVLTPQERGRADRFGRADDRRRCIVSRGLLRTMLARRLNRTPESLVFGVNPHGKPTLDDAGPIAFNASHSGGFVLVAVGCAAAIGVDIEQVRSGLDFMGVGREVFTPKERAWIAGAPDDLKARAFFRQWVFKEAVAKAAGLGLGMDLQTFEISFANKAPQLKGRAPELGGASDWVLRPVAVERGYRAALAVLPWRTSLQPLGDAADGS